MQRIKKVGVFQTSKVAAVIYFLLAAVFMIPFGLFTSFAGGDEIPGIPFGGGLFFIFLPILYGLMGFVMTAVTCLIYNLVSNWTGGIEVEFENNEEF